MCRILTDMPYRTRLKRILVDILGCVFIIASPLTGWLPGPGGIPLLIIGLSLLATNHEWAEKLLAAAKEQGVNLGQKVFSDDPRVRWAIDILSVLLITAAVYIIQAFTSNIRYSAVISLSVLGITLLLGNRQRLKKLKRKFKRK